jgi:site-specific recombinase
MRSLSIGKGIDGTIDKSELLSQAFADHKSGKRDLIADARELVAALGGAESVRDLSIAGLMQKLTASGRHSDVETLKRLSSD